MLTKSPDEIINEIIEHLKLTYGLKTNTAEPNYFGYANLKWKIDTDQGVFFVKQYNSKRYSDDLLKQVEVALGPWIRQRHLLLDTVKVSLFRQQNWYDRLN